MDLDDENLSLTDPQDMTLLNMQPISSIRVWGVGRDNGRWVLPVCVCKILTHSSLYHYCTCELRCDFVSQVPNLKLGILTEIPAFDLN